MRVIALFACRFGGALFLYLSLSVGSVVFGATVQVAVAANFTGRLRAPQNESPDRAQAQRIPNAYYRIAVDGYGLPP